jgi:hypothetical protein
MAYTVKHIQEDNVILTQLHADFDYATEGERSIIEATDALDNVTTPVYYISDISAVQFSMQDTIEGSNAAARGDNTLFHHPNIKQVLLVIGDALQQLATQGLTSNAFGNTNIKAFATLDEALDYARNNR